MEHENLIPDEAFDTGFTSSLQPEGKYVAQIVSPKVKIKTSKTGNRYLKVYAATKATEDGAPAHSELISKIVMIEGTNSKGNANVNMFAQFFSSLGYEKDEVRALLAELLETAPSANEVSEDEADVQLSINGETLNLKGKEFMAKVKVEEYNGQERNTIASTWAIDKA